MRNIILAILLVLSFGFVACGEKAPATETVTESKTETATETTTPPAGDFKKWAELDWVKIGVLKGWTETIDQGQKTIKITDNTSMIDISYTISDTPENYATNAEGGASGKVTRDKATFGKTEFIRLTIEFSGSVGGVRLFAPYASDGTSIIDINGPITPDIEKMLGSVEIK